MRRHLAVLHPSRPALLVERTAAGDLRLPFLDEPDGDPRAVGAIAAHVPGLRLASLGAFAGVWAEPEEAADGIVSEYLALFELRQAPSDAELEDYTWCASASDIELRSELAAALAELFEWLHERTDAASPIRSLPPHCLPGVTAALEEALKGARGFEPAESQETGAGWRSGLAGMEQLQAWVLSTVWLGEDAVVKVTTPLWPQEPAVTELLGRWAPDHVPPVLMRGALDVPRAGRTAPWMVSKRFVAEGPEREPSSATVLEVLARLQATALTREDELLQAGAPERGPLQISADLPVLFEEATLAGLSEAEVALLPSLAAWLTRRLEALAAVAPRLLTHGDLHLGNALITSDVDVPVPSRDDPTAHGDIRNDQEATSRTVIFDWTDAALAWPGVDLLTITPYGLSKAQQPSDLSAAKEEYLSAIRTAFASAGHEALLPRIEATLDEGADLALVYHAVSYAHIVRSVPDRQKPFVGRNFLRRAVRQLLEQFAEAS